MRKLGLLLTLLLSFVIVDKASALGVNGAQTAEFVSGHVRFDDGAGGTFSPTLEANPSSGLRRVFRSTNTTDNNAMGNRMLLGFTGITNTTIPANSLVSFQITYGLEYVEGSVATGTNMQYYGVQMANDKTMIWDSCIGNAGQNLTPTVPGYHQLTCSYLFYTGTAMTVLDSLPRQRIMQFPYPMSIYVTITINDPSYISLSNNGLSTNDRAWLEEVLPDSTTVGEVEQAIDNARESEKEEYEDQQEDVDGGAEDAGEEAEEATSSLIDTASTIIGVIRDTAPTDCIIQIQIRAFNTGSLNLCNVPQEIRNLISTVITIPITIAAIFIIYTFVTTYLDFIRKEQE